MRGIDASDQNQEILENDKGGNVVIVDKLLSFKEMKDIGKKQIGVRN